VVVDVDEAFHIMDESHPQFAEYRPKLDALNLLMESADEIWCPTVPLQDSLIARFGQTILMPNSIDPRLWCTYRDSANSPSRDEHDPFELLYVGSVTHGSDLEMIMPVLDQLEKTTPIRLTVIGTSVRISQRSWIRQINPGVNSAYPRFAPWLRRQASLFDVGIAPLIENVFNRFKSDRQILEYQAMGLVPMASAVQPYLDSEVITDQMLCSDPEAWLNSLQSLAADPERLGHLKESVRGQSCYIWEERSAVEAGNRIANRLRQLS
jgi:glycosyltransferase involved in cell wall biosynthesis